MSRGQADKVPAEYRRRQTLKNAERYITPELQTWEETVLSTTASRLTSENWMFESLLQQLTRHGSALSHFAAPLSQINPVAALAQQAHANPRPDTEPTASNENLIT